MMNEWMTGLKSLMTKRPPPEEFFAASESARKAARTRMSAVELAADRARDVTRDKMTLAVKEAKKRGRVDALILSVALELSVNRATAIGNMCADEGLLELEKEGNKYWWTPTKSRRDTSSLEVAWAASKAQYAARKERMYSTVRKGEISTPALIVRLGMSKAAASQMLRQLAAEGRVKARKSDRMYFWSVT
jgi:hypothetical protein